MQYRMICVDLDGTLLDSSGRISEANREAVGRAVDAGVRVVPCTGRAWCECRDVLRQFPAHPLCDEGVFVTGAAVSDLSGGDTQDVAPIEPRLALQVVEHLWDEPEAVLVFRDACQAGHDYLVTGAGRLTATTQWWFRKTESTVHHRPRIALDDLEHTLRVGIVADGPRMAQMYQAMQSAFGATLELQHFQAVQGPGAAQSVHILEVFASGVHKWRGLAWLARRHGIEADEIAAIGDEINDLALLEQVGCPIAMANAVEPVLRVGRHVTRSCDEDGVAYAIDKILDGEWV